jgi:hypothetical protein
MARILALEAVLAHFPNPVLIALGIERTYGERMARSLPRQMEQIRAELKREVRRLQSSNKPIKARR